MKDVGLNYDADNPEGAWYLENWSRNKAMSNDAACGSAFHCVFISYLHSFFP